MIKIKHPVILSIFTACLLLSNVNISRAQSFSFLVDSDNSQQDYVLAAADGSANITIFKDAAHPSHNMKFMQLAAAKDISSFFSYDNSMEPASDLYLVRFPKYDNSDYGQSPLVSIKYEPGSSIKGAYYYNWSTLKFEKIDALIDATSSAVSFTWPGQEELIFCLFRDPELVGNASWYVHPRYRNQLIAASVDFPKNTKLKVINLLNNKEVIVVVKDYGPDKSKHPDRVVDLSKPAFKAISALSAGVVKVKVVKIIN